MHEAACVRLAKRVTDLLQHRDHARRIHRTVGLDESLETDAIEQFHDVVELAALGRAEVVDADRMYRSERRRLLGFALEALDDVVTPPLSGSERIRTYQLDG